MRSEEKQKGGFYIKNPPFPYFVLYLTMLRLTL